MPARPLRLRLVGDGPGDDWILPGLVEGALGFAFEHEMWNWHDMHFHGMKRLAKKAEFLIIASSQDDFDGIVAVIDRDKAPRLERRKQLEEAAERQPLLPVAIGEADPHLEAWLIDDEVATKSALGLPADEPLPAPGLADNPKQRLNGLIGPHIATHDEHLQLLAAIARAVSLENSSNPRDTGFRAFVEEIRRTFGRR